MSTRDREPAGDLAVPADVSRLVEVPTVSALADIEFVEEDGAVGAGVLDVLTALVALDSAQARDGLSEGDLVELAAACERVESYAAAAKRRAAAALARRDDLREKLILVRDDASAKARGRDVLTPAQTRSFRLSETARDELSARLGISRPAAARLVAEGQAMEGHACLVGSALTNGDISVQKARIVTDALHDQPLETCLAVSDAILPAAPGLQPAELARRVQRLVIEADPAQAAERAERARAFRNLSPIQSLPDGLARISITSGRLEVAAFRTAADLAAKAAKARGDDRTMDQLRADAATTFALTALHRGELPPIEPLPGLVPVEPVPVVLAEDPEPPFSAHPEPAIQADDGDEAGDREGSADVGAAGVVHRRQRPEPAGPADAACLLVTEDEMRSLQKSAVAVRFDPRRARTLVVDESLASRGLDAPLPVGGAQSWADEIDEALSAPPSDDPSSAEHTPQDPPRRLGESVPELVGAGPLDHALARGLALDPPDWLGVVVLTAEPPEDRSTEATTAPEDGYLPSAPLRRAVLAAHPTCVGPGCHVPSTECQLDHVIPWPIGRTEAANLRPLCLRCHLLKTHAGHRYAIETTTGDIVWTTRTGHRYQRTTSGVTTHLRPDGHARPSPTCRAAPP